MSISVTLSTGQGHGQVTKADMCQDPKKIRDPGSPGSGILEDLGSYIFIFPWDLKDPGSCHDDIAVRY